MRGPRSSTGAQRIGGGPTWAARGSQLVPRVDFAALPNVAGVYAAPPSWLTLTCATTGRTSQTSSSTMVSGLGANAWRARNTGGGWGLSIESSRANLWTSGSPLGWTLSNVSRSAATTGPDGTASAYTIADTSTSSTGFILLSFNFAAVHGATLTSSVWRSAEHAVSGAPTQILINANWAAIQVTLAYVTPWTRTAFTGVETTDTGSSVIEPAINNGSNSTEGSATLAFLQTEVGAYPSSWIAGGATRAADVLSTLAALVSPGGRCNASMTFAPNFTSTEQSVDQPLLWWDANNQVFLRVSDSKIAVKIGGVVVATSSALTWSRETGISVTLLNSPRGLSLVVSGATTGNGTTTAAAQAAFSTPSTLYLLGSSSGAAECCDLRALGFSRA